MSDVSCSLQQVSMRPFSWKEGQCARAGRLASKKVAVQRIALGLMQCYLLQVAMLWLGARAVLLQLLVYILQAGGDRLAGGHREAQPHGLPCVVVGILQDACT